MPENRVKELRTVKASELKPSPKNWRTHRAPQRQAIEGVLAEVGWADAVIARELEDGSLELIDGHLRSSQDVSGDEEIPVLVVDLTEAEADIVLATHDPIAAMAGSSGVKLEELLGSIKANDARVRELLDRVIPKQVKFGATTTAEVTNPRAKLGDLYQLGDHRLVVADATDEAAVKRLFGNRKIAAIITDPPYAIGYKGGGKDWSAVYDDIEPSMIEQALKLGIEHAAGQCAVYQWFSNSRILELRESWGRLGLHWSQDIVWVKPTSTPSRKPYMQRHEPCAVGWPKGKQPDLRVTNETTVWEIDYDDGMKKSVGKDHPTQKPIETFAIPMRVHTGRGDWIYDAFVGSGTAIVAAEMLERKCLAVEKAPQFADVAIARWESISGKKAKKL